MLTEPRNWPSQDDKLAALHQQLVAAVDELTRSEAWMRMLRVAARFPDYSPSNVLLIAMQRPDATRVAGIRTWNSLGRCVVKGEHGIAILAPCVYRGAPGDATELAERAAERVTAPPPPSPPDGDGVPRRELHGFKVVHVFDVTQTDGHPLPDVAPELLRGPAPDELWDQLAALVEDDGYCIERGPCGGANGYTSFSSRVVRVRDDVEPSQAVKTLAHELGHIRADHHDRFPDYATSHDCRGQAEVEAESIAYLITAAAGLESAAYSVPYVAAWAGGSAALLRECASRAIGVARAVGPPFGQVPNGRDPLRGRDILEPAYATPMPASSVTEVGLR